MIKTIRIGCTIPNYIYRNLLSEDVIILLVGSLQDNMLFGLLQNGVASHFSDESKPNLYGCVNGELFSRKVSVLAVGLMYGKINAEAYKQLLQQSIVKIDLYQSICDSSVFKLNNELYQNAKKCFEEREISVTTSHPRLEPYRKRLELEEEENPRTSDHSSKLLQEKWKRINAIFEKKKINKISD